MEYLFPRILVVYYVGIGTIMLGLLILIGIIYGRKSPLTYILSCIVCVVVGVFVIYLSKGGQLYLGDKHVKLKIPLYHERVIAAEDIQQIQIIDLDSDSPYLPVRKISGTATKNFRSGWFKLKNGEKAFLLLEGRKGIFIQTKDGNKYIFGIHDFNELKQVFAREVRALNNELESKTQ